MKQNKSLVLPFILLIVSAALYRLIPSRPAGFAPQLGMAIFGASIIKEKGWAFLLTIGSMFLSDVLFQVLYKAGATNMQGFYEGQWVTYLTFMLITVMSFTMKRINITNVVLYTTVGSLLFFIITNFVTWKTGYGFARPQTWSGLMQCYADALAYYRTAGLIPGFIGNFILGDILWSAILFGGHYLLTRNRATAVANA